MVTSAPVGPALIVTTPAEQVGSILALSRPAMVIGHSDTADLVLEDRFVSRRHALVSVDPSGEVTITDLNSTGGTFVNEERLTGPRILQAGDLVRFADLVARFEPGAAQAGSAEVTQLLPVSAAAEPPAASSSQVGSAASASPPDATATPGMPGDGGSGGAATTDAGAVAPGTTYTITGTALSPALPGVGGLIVQLIDKNVGGDQLLASTLTDSGGSYAFRQLISDTYLAARHKTEPDLQVQVLAGDNVLAASDVSYSAPVILSLDVVLPANAAGLPSEYETLTGNLAAAYPGSLSALQENAAQQDITYLANKTGWDARAVALAALADQFSQVTAPSPVRTADSAQTLAYPVPTVSIKPEFYYALFRAGMPASPDSLFQVSSGAAKAIWEHAVRNGIIPAALAEDVPTAIANFQAISAARSPDAPPLVGVSTLREMLAHHAAGEGAAGPFRRSFTRSTKATGRASGAASIRHSGSPRRHN